MRQSKVNFTPRNVVNLFVYELDRWLQDLNTDFTLKDCLYGTVNLTRDADPDKCSYLGYSIRFDSRSLCLFPNFDWNKTVVIFGVNNSSSAHIGNKKKSILVFRKGLTQELDDTTITTEAEYSIYYSRSQTNFGLRFHYKVNNSFLFANATKIISIQSKRFGNKTIFIVFRKYLKIFSSQ